MDLDYENYLEIDEKIFRPSEAMLLRGDATKARKELGWNYVVSFEDLINEMIEKYLDYLKEMI